MRNATAPRSSTGTLFVLGLLVVAAVFAAYSNHFHNAFQFDDGTVIQNNAYLRSLRNIPLFFRNGSTFSSLPNNADYRPLTGTSFALDYWRGGGLDPYTFHVTQWVCHVLLGTLIVFFLRHILDLAGLAIGARLLALGGGALFGLHRVNTETVNYITQRSEILATIGVVGSFVAYQYAPRWRRTWLWLLPFVAGAFAKPTAVMFAPLFAAYLLVFPEERAAVGPKGSGGRRSMAAALVPLALAALLLLGQTSLQGPSVLRATTPPLDYFRTQIFAWLHYFRLFFLPLGLSADTDWSPIADWFDTRVFAGALFALLFVGGSALYARRRPPGRAVLYGTLWYFLALVPSSSVVPLAEAINEHRPYFPYVGLILGLTAAVGDLIFSSDRRLRRGVRRAVAVVSILALAAHGVGTWRRNRVWLSAETLWKSVTEASPGNGRAWMNYGLIFMARGAYPQARACFEHAAALVPNYAFLEINMGILEGAVGNGVRAEQHFQRALALNAAGSPAHLFYGRWLHENHRDREAAEQLEAAVAQSSPDLDARHLLVRVYEETGDKERACAAARDTLRVAPADPEAEGAVSRDCSAR